jgi:uncharacterized membrane protein
MTSDSLFPWIAVFASGLTLGGILSHLFRRRTGGTFGAQPLVLNEGRTIRRAVEALPD